MVTPRYAETRDYINRVHDTLSLHTHSFSLSFTPFSLIAFSRRIHLDNIKINLYLANSNSFDRGWWGTMYTNGGLNCTHSLSFSHSFSLSHIHFFLLLNNRKLITPSFTYIQLSRGAFLRATTSYRPPPFARLRKSRATDFGQEGRRPPHPLLLVSSGENR